MADVVPLNRRVDIRQEILSMESDDEALKVRERQEVKVKVQRSLQEAEAQSFQLYVDRAIRKKEGLHKALREHREPTPEESSARQRHKELVTDEMLDNEMAILAPLQEGMQALPAEEVANEGARALRKVNLERFKAKLREEAQRGAELVKPGGVARCPIWRRRPPKGATGPGGDQPVPPQNLDTEEGKLSLLLWAMKRHQGELRMFGGIWKKHSSGEIPKGADQQFKLSPEELLALERRTHPLTCERDHIDPIIYSALEIRAQVNRGERPAPEQVVAIFWAKGDGVFWTRQTRTWDLPSLTGVYAHRFTFKYIYC